MSDFRDRNQSTQSARDGASTSEFLLQTLAVILLPAVAFTANFTQVWNPDVLWQLASGQWMAENRQILRTSTFSTDAETPWVNVHWLFQLGIAGLHGMGGFAALTLLKAGLAAGTMLIFGLSLRRHVPPAWLILAGLLGAVVMGFRIRVRPEALTFLLLIIALVLTDIARRDKRKAKLLWLLLPIQLLWVNTHGLFILGPIIYITAVLGDAIDARLTDPKKFRDTCANESPAGNLLRKAALLPMAGALLMCFISPWPIRTILLPLKLLGEIFSLTQTVSYSQNISELLPAWSDPLGNPLALVLVVATFTAMALNFRRVSASHWLWLIAFGGVALFARRNVGLLGPVFGFLLGWHGWQVIRQLGKREFFRSKWIARLSTAAVYILACLAFLDYSQGWFPAWLGNDGGVPGAELQRDQYALGSAKFLQDSGVEGDVFCENFGDAGAFIYYSGPRTGIMRRVFMDGRAEAHTPERFARQQELQKCLASPQAVADVDLPDDIRFVFVSKRSGGAIMSVLQSRRFVLLWAEPAGALFARRDWSTGLVGLDTQAGLEHLDRPLLQDNTLGNATDEKTRQPVNLDLAQVLLHLGLYNPSPTPTLVDPTARRCCMLAVRYMTAASKAGLLSNDLKMPMLAQTWLQWSLQDYKPATPELPFDLNLARTLYIFNKCDLENQSDTRIGQFALQKSQARQLAGEIVYRAIDQLYAKANLSPEEWLMLGDLLLRTGQTDQARLAYNRLAELMPKWENDLQHRFRLAMCDWVTGQYYQAVEELNQLTQKFHSSSESQAVRFYLTRMLEQLGLYNQAWEVISAAKTGSLTSQSALQIYQLKQQLDTLAIPQQADR